MVVWLAGFKGISTLVAYLIPNPVHIYIYIYIYVCVCVCVCVCGVMFKAMDCGIVVSEFVLQSRYYVHFRANTLGKGMNPLILPAMG